MIRQKVDNEWQPLDCPDCQGLIETRYSFVPAANSQSLGSFIFQVVPGHCDQYRNDGTYSREVSLTQCPTEAIVTSKSQNQNSLPLTVITLFGSTLLLARLMH